MAKKNSQTEEKVLTGYEETNEHDTHQELGGDDVNFPGSNPPAEETKKPAGPKGKPDTKEMEDLGGFTGPTGPVEVEKETKPHPFFEDDEPEEFDFPSLDKKEEGSTGPTGPIEQKEELVGETGSTGAAEETVKDPFDLTELEKSVQEEQIQKEEIKKFDWKKFGKEKFSVDLTENDPEELASKINERIDQAKTKVEVDTSKYSEDSKKVIEFLEAGGDFNELLNPVAKIDQYITESDEDDIVKDYYIAYEGMKEDDAEKAIEDLHDEDKFEEKYAQVKKILMDYRNGKAKEVLEASTKKVQERVAKAEQKINSERAEMVKVVDELTDFMGQKLPDKAKDFIKKEISTGRLSEVNNNAKTQVYARLFELFGQRIIDSLNEQVKAESRKGYNTGKEKEQERLHNIPPGKSGIGALEQKAKEQVNPLAGFMNIDKDAIEPEY